MMLKLTEEVRDFAKKPFGVLYKDISSLEFYDELLACVGDIVSLTTLKAGIKPNIIVFDGRSVRKRLEFMVDKIRSLSEGYVEVIAKNPAGCITEDLVEKVSQAVKYAKNGLNVRIFVMGEEDLTVMPLVILLPKGSVILYGQPNEGVVKVDVNDERKFIILRMLERMEGSERTLEKMRRWCNGCDR